MKLNFIFFSIRTKLQLIIISNILIVAATAFFTLHFVSESHKSILYEGLTSSLSYSGSEIADSLDLIDNVADNVFANSSIQENLILNKTSNQKSEKKIYNSSIYSTLTDYVYTYKNIGLSYITIIQNNDIFSTSLISNSELPQEMIDDLVKEGENAEGKTKWITKYGDQYGLFIVKEIRSIDNLKFENLGILIVNINLDKLISATSAKYLEYGNSFYALSQDNTIITCSDTIDSSKAEELIQDNIYRYKILSIDSENFYTVSSKIPKYDWNYLVAVSYDEIMKTTTLTQTIWIIILLFAIVFSLIISTLLSDSIINHLTLLVTKMKSFGSNSYQADKYKDTYINRTDEIGVLHNTFDSMVNQINTLIEKDYKNELLNKEAQIKALENQIDPHFLYNTLDTINWTAKSIGANSISDISIALANLLRISLSKDDRGYTIKQEIDTLNYYFTIQQVRYQKRLDYSINIPDDLLDYEIPKLTLQPLIENSIRYGLEEMTDICHISVNAWTENKDIIIEVSNNGSSFENDMLEKLLSNKIIPNGFGVGISNIHKRLQLTYGPNYGLTLHSQINNYTGEETAIVRIKIPKKSI